MKWKQIILLIMVVFMLAENIFALDKNNFEISQNKIIVNASNEFVFVNLTMKNYSCSKTFDVEERNGAFYPRVCCTLPNNIVAGRLKNETVGFDINVDFANRVPDVLRQERIKIGTSYYYIPKFYMTIEHTGYSNTIS